MKKSIPLTIASFMLCININAQEILGYCNVSKGALAYSENNIALKLNSKNPIPYCGFAKIGDSESYNAYELSSNGVSYYLNSALVLDNGNLDAYNARIKPIQDTIAVLEHNLAVLNIEINTANAQHLILKDSVKLMSKKLASDSLTYYKGLNDNLYNYINSCEQAYDKAFDIRLSDWEKSLTANESKLYNIATGLSYYLTSSNTVGGHDFNLSLINNSDKVVKYMTVYMKGYKNKVGDYVAGEYGEDTILKSTGPYEKGTNMGGSWANVLYNWSAYEPVVNYITIIYMDNTKCTLTSADLNTLSNSGKLNNRPNYTFDSIKLAQHINDRLQNYESALKSMDSSYADGYLVLKARRIEIPEITQLYQRSQIAKDEYESKSNEKKRLTTQINLLNIQILKMQKF